MPTSEIHSKEIIPFIASIDITEGNAREANVRFVRRLLLSYGARPAIIGVIFIMYIYSLLIVFIGGGVN